MPYATIYFYYYYFFFHMSLFCNSCICVWVCVCIYIYIYDLYFVLHVTRILLLSYENTLCAKKTKIMTLFYSSSPSHRPPPLWRVPRRMHVHSSACKQGSEHACSMSAWSILPMSLLHFCAWEHFSYIAVYAGLENSRISSKQFEDERRSYGFGTT